MEQEIDREIFRDLTTQMDVDGIDIEELEEISNSSEGFPYVVLIFAASKDMTDTITAGLGSFFTTPIASGVILFWMMGKGSFIQKMMRKWFMKRLLIMIAAKFFPGLNMLPLTSLLVIMAHYREKKIIQAIDILIEVAYENRQMGFEEIMEVIERERILLAA